MSKFDAQDMEVIGMVNRAAEERRKREDIIEVECVAIDEAAEARAEMVKLAAGVAGRATAGCIFLGAITRGWAEPAFGLAGAALFFLWALAFARRK